MSELKKENYHISGMHCRSCEIMVEDSLSQIAGVKKAEVNYKKGVAEIHYDQKPAHTEVEKAIRNAGYALGVNKKRPLISSNPLTYIELFFVAGILATILMWLKLFGVFDLNFQFSSAPGFLAIVLIGLVAGVSTCMALIGGLVLGVSTRHAELHPEATASQKFKPHLFFNLGRLIAYAILGGALGLIGSIFSLSSSMTGFIIIFAGIVMFFLGLKMTEIFPRLDSGGLLMPKRVARLLGTNREVKEYSHKGAFWTGAVTFFLPCGFTQAMRVYAISTGSFTKGAVIMFLFALGTMPGLLGIGGLTSVIKGWFARYFFKFVALVLLILAVWNISNGYNLTGIVFAGYNQNNVKEQKLSGEVVNGEQVVKITQSGSGSIRVRLVDGLNEITFTPSETGPIKFSCSMGMYTGVINVIN
ncbi:MAG: sulfite exporter TauE/SafE family protein [Candidatus Yanofskybacteria bacterium]|nr:sulfite exporter TauE/SafE family protein [Candidatus Yanofskybacteria bacterium]